MSKFIVTALNSLNHTLATTVAVEEDKIVDAIVEIANDIGVFGDGDTITIEEVDDE